MDAPTTASRAIDYGDRLRAGLLVPSGNSVAEPEIHAMLPHGVSALVTRLELRGSSERELLHMIQGLEAGARLLADARVAAVVFHCTAVSTFAPHLAPEIRRRIEDATGLPAFTTSDAILAAMAALPVCRVTLLTPYLRDVHDREVRFLRDQGLDVVTSACLGIDTNDDMGRLDPRAIADFVRGNACEAAEAYLLSCTAIRSAGLIAKLEAELGAPVLTSNQAMVWYLLRSKGIADHVVGFGEVFGRTLPRLASGRREEMR